MAEAMLEAARAADPNIEWVPDDGHALDAARLRATAYEGDDATRRVWPLLSGRSATEVLDDLES